MPRLSWFAVPLLLSLAACALPGAPGAAPLVGSEWRLEDLGGRGVLDRVQATLAFPEAGRVTGNSSCNRFFGSYTLMQDRIALGQLAGTRMACAPAVDEQETRYLDALQKAQRLEVRGTTMLMHVQGLEKPLRFVRIKP
ncbi:MAG: META domain-containing protein [Hydrogenophaga sp.]|uniref:META domain-containing protein n=1 Tax=Hydrogenophaga sp. TaxID=1904254 RepID=UPI00271DC307|nr:META domain-containing protein [Hydrogenophaga sp.]MDO8887614.1 META domain-containing protein [Hydrogenophaga sp.]MDP1781606.1 META domain-containing protein [Hydrogenophaga sp.]MDP2251268.1 META domain-containing protein [Hydrogenophaga sp.]